MMRLTRIRKSEKLMMNPPFVCRTSLVLRVYREAIIAGVVPTMEEFSQVLGCLRLPHDASLRNRLIENLGVSTETSKGSNLCSLLDGFGEYDPRAFSLLEVYKQYILFLSLISETFSFRNSRTYHMAFLFLSRKLLHLELSHLYL